MIADELAQARLMKGADDALAQSAPFILEARDLSFSYGRTRVWHEVNVSLRSGEIAMLVGANGAGKSTLLRCLAGWLGPDSGTIEVCGTPLGGSSAAPQARLALVNDTPSFFDDLTCGEHIELVMRVNRSPNEERAFELLERFGLQGVTNKFPFTFSRGMRYKLALTIALALEPRLLLLDEPFGPLDSPSCGLLASELTRASARGAAVLFSGHQPPSDLAICRSLLLEDETLQVAPLVNARPE